MTGAPIRWTRRTVTALFVSLLGWPLRRAEAQAKQTPLQQTLLSLFENLDSAGTIGRTCLNALPPEVLSLYSLEATILEMPSDEIRERITHQIAEDFVCGSIVNIEGWYLSLTEAQLYALVAVNFPRAA